MIYHLTVSGMPISWNIAAIYEKSAGIANCAAETWHRKTNNTQCLIEIEDDKIVMTALHWSDEGEPLPDDTAVYISGFAGENPIVAETQRDLICSAVRDLLIEHKFLIPRAEWESNYPAAKLIQDRSKAFRAAQDALKDGEELAFEDRWIPFMEPPEDFIPAYQVHIVDRIYYGIKGNRGLTDPTGGIWGDIKQANNVCRLLNSGWTWEETKIIMAAYPAEKR